MKKSVCVFAGAGLLAIALVAGCEWSAGSSAESFTDRYNWVNFNGIYRGVNGGLLVTDYTAMPGVADTTQRTSRETVGTGDGVTDRFTGVARHGNIVSGTFIVEAGNMYWYDDGGGTLTAVGPGAVDGRIVYNTGAWMIEGVVPAGVQIIIRYAYTVDSSQTGISRPGSGASRIRIYSFTVVQEGERLTITDNNGSTYAGSISRVVTDAGSSHDTPQGTIRPVDGSSVTAHFSVTGRSAANVNVKIAGVFRGDVAVSTNGAARVTNRRMQGTWIEMPGKTGDVNGIAP